MPRLTKTEYAVLGALCASTRSEDPSTKVGGVLENKESRIIALGYNGLKSGVSYRNIFDRSREDKLDNFVHCETNILSLVKRGDGHRIILTTSPCAQCCLNIIAHDIKEVVYLQEYHACDKFKKILKENNVACRQVTKEEIKNILGTLKESEKRLLSLLEN